jgi:isopentenyl phosphate kinase
MRVIDRLMEEVKGAWGANRIILGHGSGSFAHLPAHKFRVNDGLRNKNSVKGAAITQFSASELHAIVMGRALKAGMPALSFSPSSGVIARRGRVISWDIAPIKKALDYGFLPIGYGDVVIDDAHGVSVASTEEILGYLARKLNPHRIIVGTDVDGIFTSDPKIDKAAKLIRRVDSENIREVLKTVGGSRKVDVTGGMKSKLEHVYNMSRETGTICQIMNANREGELYRSLTGNESGTIIDAR